MDGTRKAAIHTVAVRKLPKSVVDSEGFAYDITNALPRDGEHLHALEKHTNKRVGMIRRTRDDVAGRIDRREKAKEMEDVKTLMRHRLPQKMTDGWHHGFDLLTNEPHRGIGARVPPALQVAHVSSPTRKPVWELLLSKGERLEPLPTGVCAAEEPPTAAVVVQEEKEKPVKDAAPSSVDVVSRELLPERPDTEEPNPLLASSAVSAEAKEPDAAKGDASAKVTEKKEDVTGPQGPVEAAAEEEGEEAEEEEGSQPPSGDAAAKEGSGQHTIVGKEAKAAGTDAEKGADAAARPPLGTSIPSHVPPVSGGTGSGSVRHQTVDLRRSRPSSSNAAPST